jgi:putative lipoprotein
MSPDISTAARTLARVALATLLGLLANRAMAQSIQGTSTYRERMALPPAAVFEATLEDVSRADAPAETIARAHVASPGNPPIAVSGSDGCNRISGSYDLKGDAVTFGQMAGTQMACLDTGESERAFARR